MFLTFSLRLLRNAPLKDIGDTYALSTFQLNTHNFFEAHPTLHPVYFPKTPKSSTKATPNKNFQPTTTSPIILETSPSSTINITPDDTSQVSVTPSKPTTPSPYSISTTTKSSVPANFRICGYGSTSFCYPPSGCCRQ